MRSRSERVNEIMLLDVVAVLEDVPQHGLLCVEVGTVVELWKDGVFEVEFSDLREKSTPSPHCAPTNC